MRFLFLLVLWLLSCPWEGSAAEGASLGAYTPLWKNETITPEATATVIGLLNQELAAIAGEVADDSQEGRRRTQLKNRVALLRQLGEVLSRRKEMAATHPEKGRSEAELDAAIREWEKKTPPALPSDPDQDAFKILSDKRTERLNGLKGLQDARNNRRQLVQRIPEMILQAKAAQKAAEEELQKLPAAEGKADVAKKSLVALKAENAHLGMRVGQEQIALWNAELAFEKEHGVRLDKELELAQRMFDWYELQYKQYQEALNRLQTQNLEVKSDALAQKEKDAEKARTPAEKFLAQWEVLVAQTQKNTADWQQLRTELASVITAQEGRIKEEEAELANLTALVKRMGSQGMAAELLKSTFRLKGQRRLELAQVVPPALKERLAQGQSRRLEIDSRLGGLRDQWRGELEAVLEGNDRQRAQMRDKASRFLDAFRRGLLDEKKVLFEINVDERRLELLAVERGNLLDAMERFVLSKVFWIQDAEPVGFPLFKGALEEIGAGDREKSLLHWVERFFSAESLQRLREAVYRPLVIFYGVLLSLSLLIGIPLSRRWIHSLHRFQSQEPERGTHRLLPILIAVAEAAWWSVYFLIVALALDAAGLPEGVGTVLARVFIHLALFFFLWRLGRRLFDRHGIARQQFLMPADLCATLWLAMRALLVAYPVLLMPWVIFRGAPFDFQALPRLSYTAYELTVTAVLYYLMRDASPLVRHSFWQSEQADGERVAKRGVLAENWRLISSVIFLSILAVVGLDVMGYRFGAAAITRNGLATMVTLFLLIGAYRLTVAMAMRLGRDRGWGGVVAPGEDDRQQRYQSALSMRKFLRLLFVVGGGLILASYWGVNRQTLDALNEFVLFSSTLPDGSVDLITVADLLRAVIILFVAFWLVHHLPGILELLLFSRLSMDQGARYAILTIGRYLVVLIGLPWALAALHVDVGKIAWLAAAISVGIGFGLQEIVANFVSGIILLLERPVRVGDRISVGAVMGEVRRINIRATRVMNQDLQEILIPNRDLITKEVINWTLSSREVRLMIPIGVGYGSDVEQVRKLLYEVARNEPLVLRDPPPRVLFMNHGPSALEFQLRVYHVDPDVRAQLTDRLNTAINRVFRAHDIEIPFPQQELHIRASAPVSNAAPSAPPLETITSMIRP
ncbi:MAG: mechanosensitive ion channel [Magnetococcales bacterium]|nr:mechanosensitive ion channel [Magnetococcales bacterium]